MGCVGLAGVRWTDGQTIKMEKQESTWSARSGIGAGEGGKEYRGMGIEQNGDDSL